MMVKKLWRSFVGAVKWVFWVLVMALVVNVMFLCALLVTPAMFFFFWKARTTGEVFQEVAEKIADRIAEEIRKMDDVNMVNDVEFEMETDDDEDNLF
jgi:cell division protein FtsX